MRRLAIVLFVAALLFPLSDSMGGGEALDIQAELARPGVKLLVVEFYATWCKPCMKAVPEWKKLHRKYKKEGLRFIVVSADEGVCAKPPEWSPDVTVCDTEGVLQRKFEVSDLPTSLLFSWEGNVAMRSHRVEPVETAISSYFRDTTYKIEVDQVEVIGDKYAIESNPMWVRDEVVARLKSRSKFSVVTASSSFIPKKSSDTCQASFPSNSNLRIRLTGDASGERYLSLQLEKDGCIKASAQSPYKGKDLRVDKKSLRLAAREAVDKLLAQVITVKEAQNVDDGIRVQTYRNRFDDDGSTINNPIVDEKGYLAVESDPEEATVYINGKEAGVTPLVKEMMVGEYVVVVKSGALWIPAQKRVKLTEDGVQLKMNLGPNYGVLKVSSKPSEAEIWLNGEPTGNKTPYTFPWKKSGEYKVMLKKKMYFSRTIPVRLGEGKTVSVNEHLEENFGSIRVTSEPAGAHILIDGTDTGKITPATIGPVAVGGREVTLTLGSYNDFKKLINVDRGQRHDLAAVLTGQMGLLKIVAFTQKKGLKRPVLGARVFLNGEEAGKTPFKKKVLTGTYKIKVRDNGGGYGGDVFIKEGTEKRVEAMLTQKDSRGVLWVYSTHSRVYFSKTEITLGQYKKCVEAGICDSKHHRGKSEDKYCNWGYGVRNDYPMNCVDWYGAKQFCEWAEGRLPTEKEWYAEASYNQSRKYPWGDEEVNCSYAIVDDGGSGCGNDNTWRVCSKPSGNSVSGLCDMSGNVWEWTSGSDGKARVLRGGGWGNNGEVNLCASSRARSVPTIRGYSFGFRCVRDD